MNFWPGHTWLYTALALFGLALLVAVAISFMVPPLVALLGECRAGSVRLRQALVAWITDRWIPKLTAFWRSRAAEPRGPIVGELRRIRTALDRCGNQALHEFQTMDRSMTHRIAILKAFSLAGGSAEADVEGLAAAADRGSLTSVIGIGLLALVLGFANAFILQSFFRETLGTQRVLPYPLPDLQLSQVFAWLFFLIEIASGWAIHKTIHASTDDAAAGKARSRFFEFVPWIMLGGLALVEMLAYSVLSQRMGMPRLLNISQDSAFYGIVNNSFALFGLGVTGMLAFCGHAFADAIRNYRLGKATRAVLRALRNVKSVTVEAGALSDTMALVTRDSATLPTTLAATFQIEAASPRADVTLTASVHAALELALRGPAADGTPSGGAIRTRSQIVADWLIHTAMLAGVLLIGWLAAVESTLAVGSTLGAPWAGLLFGVVLSGVAALAGFLLAGATGFPRYSESNAGHAGGAGSSRSAQAFIGMVVLITLAHVMIAEFSLLFSNRLLAAVIGLVQGSALAALGMKLDQSLVTLLNLVQMAWLGLVRLVVFGGSALLVCFEFLMAAISVVGRLLAVPGDLIRRTFRRASPVLQPA